MTNAPAADTPPDLCEELPQGTELMMGQYTISEYLNHGGFGITYVAQDSLNRRVVVKECFPGTLCRRSRLAVQARSRAHVNELQGVIKLFMREAHALSKLEHPNIVGVHQVFEDHGTAYMVLDFIEGSDLLPYAERTSDELLPAADIKAILSEVLDAIGFMHNAGLLHRDISPDNIILTKDKTPILIDFGAAREQATKTTQALSALRIVKDGYSPQEFYLAGSEQGPSSDLYSLAATFYHIITGETPPDSQLRITAHVGKDPDPYVPLGQKTDAFDKNFCEAIDRALAILPRDRLQTAAEWKKLMETPEVKTKSKRTLTKPSRRLSKLTQAKATPVAKRKKAGKNGAQKSTIAATVAAVSILAGGVIFDRTPKTEAALPAVQATAPTVAAKDVSVVNATPVTAPAATPAVQPQENRLVAIDIANLGNTWNNGLVTLTWSVDAPISLDADGKITKVAQGFPVPSDTATLVSVNGDTIADQSSLSSLIQTAALQSDGVDVPLDFVFVDTTTDTEVAHQANAGLVYETQLTSGLRVETRANGDMWISTVVQLPTGTDSSLQVGDQIVALVPENQRVAGGDSLATLIAAQADAGARLLEFAIRRNGTLWTAKIDLDAGTG